MKVVGLDACKQGWVAATLEDGTLTSIEVVGPLDPYLQNPDVRAIGIDIPIGLPEKHLCERLTLRQNDSSESAGRAFS
jgi:predicted RNase H-like nuclease